MTDVIDAVIEQAVRRVSFAEAWRRERLAQEALRLHEGSPFALHWVEMPYHREVPTTIASQWPQEGA